MITKIFSDTRLDNAINGYIKMYKIIFAIVTIIALIGSLLQKDIYVLMTALFVLGLNFVIAMLSIPIIWYIYRLTTLSFYENKFGLLIWSIVIYGMFQFWIIFQTIDFNILMLIIYPVIGAIAWCFAWVGGFIAIHIYLWFDKVIKRDYLIFKMTDREFNFINSILVILFILCALYAAYDQLIANK